MRTLIVALLPLALWIGVASSETLPPPLVYCFVDPWDGMHEPRAVGVPNHRDGVYDPSPTADFTVTILNENYDPVPYLFVEIIFHGDCTPGLHPSLCLCEEADLTGYTDHNGQVTLNLGLGGCCADQSALEIRANGVSVYFIDQIVSPDWDGEIGDCEISLPDFIVFSRGFSGGLAGCTDLTGDRQTGLSDFILFTRDWMRACPPD